MNFDLKQAAKHVVADLRELAKLTSDAKGAQRVAWTPLWQKSRDWFANKAKESGASIEIDSAGNTWATIKGKSSDAVVVGSHIDCVPNGGWLDGCLGVVVTLEILRRYGNGGQKPEKTIHAVNWADEEGARFGRSLMGASAASGTMDVKELINLVDNDGNKIKDVLAKYNVHLDKILNAHREFKKRNAIAALELHIEQGPVLENQNKNVACVYGITGVERHFIKFTGQAAHAGSFPTEIRQDAFLTAAKSALAFREIALKYNGVCTVGKVKVHPDVVTIVPDECVISLDQRSIDKKLLAKMYKDAQTATKKFAEKDKVKVEWSKIWTIEPTIFDKKLVKLCKESVKEETGEDTTMYSGPLHDIAEMAKIIPSVMMFAMSKRGLSHCKEEDTPDSKLETSIRAFLRLVNKVVC
ncbi:MAG TPA: Zn-dependent hydrolase [Lentisphaeria bacterium]|nr:MAG: Zn-dependent hydrolase [Lentisphaerae bacterium GWF2_38_69]HBM15372.1 Zn-dependent hydrolase [Lentisphaeria bacterium]